MEIKQNWKTDGSDFVTREAFWAEDAILNEKRMRSLEAQ